MHRPLVRAPLALFVLLAAAPAGDGQEASREPALETADGLAVRLWAESPRLYNPTAIDVDARGRVWVTEVVNYRRWGGRNPGLDHPEGERVVILEDEDGDGRCDSSKVFVQDPELLSPLGIAVLGDRVFVSTSPNLFVYHDDDGDDVADRRETFLTGFGGPDHDHGLHSVVAGPDGRLYGAVGNAGPHLVTDRDGWTLRSGSLYDGGGPQRADNKPGLLSDDGKVWTGGLLFRVGQDARGLRVLAHNFRNNYEVALDSFGNLYQTDNDDDGNQGCRTLFCLEGGNHGFFSPDGSRTWQADRRPGQDTQRAHWHQDDPGVVPAGSINGAGGPTGIAVYEGELLAPWIDGAVLNTDAGAGVLYAHRPTHGGGGVPLEKTVLVRSRTEGEPRRAHTFRPSDVAVGTDGAVYVADWYDPVVGGHLMLDREAYGRILRIAPAGEPSGETGSRKPPRLEPDDLDGALAALASPAPNVREGGRARLVAAGADARERLREAFEAAGGPLKARLLWILARPPFSDRPVLERALADADDRLRVAAVRAGAPWPLADVRRLGLATDRSPAVRRELCLQLADVPLADGLDLLLELAERHDGDRTYLEAFGLAAAGREEALFAELAAALGDAPARWDARFEDLAWRLHPPAAIDAWVARASDVTLPAGARQRAVDALAFTPDRRAAEACLLLAQTGPDDVRDLAAWWVRQRDTNDWRGYGLGDRLQRGDLEAAEAVFESEVLRSGSVAIDVDVSGASTLWLVVEDGGDGNACDWAAWGAPRFVGGGREESLTELPWIDASCEWGEPRVNANCAGGPLALGERELSPESGGPGGFGVHAFSRLAFAVPEGAERFLCEAGPERGGTSQNEGRSTSVRFRVLLERAPDPGRLAELEERALDAGLPADERRAAATELALDPLGALRWIHRAEKGELPDELRAPVGEALFRNPDVGVRALASQSFERPGEGARSFPPVAELVGRLAAGRGDVARGRELFLDRERAQCVTCHVVRSGDTPFGGDVGPDLTLVREKYGPAELLDAILNPSAAIAFGYDAWTVELDDGTVYAGFVLADGDDVVLKDTQGTRYVLPAKEIVERQRQTVSTMPEGVALGLEPDELVDLVAFLLDDPAAERTLGDEVVLFDGAASLDGWTWYCPDPTVPLAHVWSVEQGVLRCEGSPIGYLRTDERFTSFLLTLEWRFDPARGPGNSGVLLRVSDEDEVWPRSIEAQLHHRDAGDVWNIGAFGMQPDPARTSGRRTTRTQPSSEHPLGEWNRYEILLDGPRLELRVNGVLQNTVDWCEERPGRLALQSEGATIEFRDVRLRPILRPSNEGR